MIISTMYSKDLLYFIILWIPAAASSWSLLYKFYVPHLSPFYQDKSTYESYPFFNHLNIRILEKHYNHFHTLVGEQ